MKKVLLSLLALLISTNAYADVCSKPLTGLFTSFQANKLCASFGSGFNSSVTPSADNTYDLGTAALTWRTLYTGTGIIAKTSEILRVRQDAQRLFTFDGSSDTALSLTWGDGGVTAVQKFTISASTADADDDSTLILSGGGAGVDITRGAYATFAGEEVSGGGDFLISAGGASGDDGSLIVPAGGVINLQSDSIVMKTAAGTASISFGTSAATPSIRGGSTSFQINNNANSVANLTIADAGTATFRNSIISNSTTDIGWSVVNASNQACNTTCTSGCVVGIDTLGTGGFLSCATATADSCICAGPS